MRLSIVLSLLLTSLICTAQFEWEELPPITPLELQPVGAISDSQIIAYHDLENSLYLSNNNGLTWQKIENSENRFLHYDLKIRTNYSGETYILIFDGIYYLDQTSVELVPFFIFRSIDEFGFLPNDDLLVATSSELRHYDSQMILKDSFNINLSFSMNFLLSDGNRHYLIDDIRRTIRFYDSEKLTLSIAFNTASNGRDHLIMNDTIFSTHDFSTNGTEWYSYPKFEQFDKMAKNGDFLVGFTHDSIYHTLPGKLNFQSNSIPFFEYPLLEVFYSNNRMWLHSNVCLDQTFYYTDDIKNINSWRLISDRLKTSIYHQEAVSAGENGTLIAFTCDAISYLYDESTQEWTRISTLSDQECLPNTVCPSLPNGEYVSHYGCNSKNGGKAWFNIGQLNFGSARVRNDIIYIIDGQLVYKSEDYGASCKREIFPINHSSHDDIVSPNEELIYIDYISQSEFYQAINSKGIVRTLSIPERGTNNLIETSYKGDYIYAVNYIDNLSAHEFFVSDDNGLSHKVDTLYDIEGELIAIEVDHKENIYLISDNTILYSNDHGQSFEDISPQMPDIIKINDLDVGYNGYVYVATSGSNVLKSKVPIFHKNTLHIYTYLDANNNCTPDPMELPIPNINISIGQKQLISTDNTGYQSIHLIDNIYDVRPVVNEDIFNTCLSSSQTSFDATKSTDTIFIGIRELKECPEIKWSVSGHRVTRCRPGTYTISTQNIGSSISVSNEVKLSLNSNFRFDSSSLNVISNVGNVYVLDFGDINPGQKKTGIIHFTADCDIRISNLCSLFEYFVKDSCGQETRYGSDYCVQDIRHTRPDLAKKASFVNDEADKLYVDSNRLIEYEIQFQNITGDTVSSVTIVDQLQAIFEIASIRPLNSSHPYTWQVDHGELRIDFDNISLKDSSVDFASSFGYIRFEAALKQSTAPGTEVINQAYVTLNSIDTTFETNMTYNYFLCQHSEEDIEAVICEGKSYLGYTETGTYIDTLVNYQGCDSIRTLELEVLPKSDPKCRTISTQSVDKTFPVRVYPNPFNSMINIEIEEPNIDALAIYNMMGNQVYSTPIESTDLELDLNELKDGCYVLALKRENQVIKSKIIIKLESS